MLDQIRLENHIKGSSGLHALRGWSLARAMEKGPITLPDNLVAAISVAEETGHLEAVLSRLTDELDAGAEAHQALSKGLLYPAAMVAVGPLPC